MNEPIKIPRMHKGRLRQKFRLPRKKKKAFKKGTYIERLIVKYGDEWMDYWIMGG
jgi:hypothetical protein